MRIIATSIFAALSFVATATTASGASPADAERAIDPAKLPAVGKVDERFQAYNVESVEVAGGNFWAPYPKLGDQPRAAVAGPQGTGFATDAFQHRNRSTSGPIAACGC